MVVQFGACSVDFDRVEIRIGDTFSPVQPQVFRVIEYLIANRHRVVTKEELLDNVWGDRFVTESALTSRIKSARRALGDNGNDQSVIKTVHGLGYRFVAVVAGDDHNGHPPGDVALADRGVDGGSTPPSNPWPFVGRFDELDEIERCLTDGSTRAVLIRGPHWSGATRLADEATRAPSLAGFDVLHVRGIAAARDIPLAALTHLLPADVLDTEDPSGYLARATVFRRAIAEFERRLDGSDRRAIIVVIDDVGAVDELSRAVLASMITSGVVLGLVTERPTAQDAASFADLVSSTPLRIIDLPSLSETDVDTVLYRVLEGPIDLISLGRLNELSSGLPGLLRDVVEASRAVGALRRHDGVWRLTGAAASSTSLKWPITALSAMARRAAEMLALARHLEMADAIELLGQAALDELDDAQLLALQGFRSGVQRQDRVVIGDPLLAERIRESVGSLRARTLKTELATALLTRMAALDTYATVVTWADDIGLAVDDERARSAARRAMIVGQDTAADELVAHFAGTDAFDSPDLLLIRGELAFRRNQFSAASELFDLLDLDQLGSTSRALVIRRLATITFQARGRQSEGVELLEAHEAAAGPDVRYALTSHRGTLLVMMGHATAALDVVRDLRLDVGEQTAIEVMLTKSQALLLAGQLDASWELAGDVERRIAPLPSEATQLPREAISTIRLGVLFARGDIEQALRLVRQWTLIGRRSIQSWLPLMASRIELAAEHPRAARELARATMEQLRVQTGTHSQFLGDAFFWAANVDLGLHEVADVSLDRILSALPTMVLHDQCVVAQLLGSSLWSLGRGTEVLPMLVSIADTAGRVGADLDEAGVASLAASLDPTPATATSVLERVEDFAARVDGHLWPIRAAHVRARSSGGDLTEVAARYSALGFHRLARMASLGS